LLVRGGGAERVMVILANEFATRGFKVDLVVSNAVGPYVDLVSDKVNIVDLESPKVLFSLGKFRRYIKNSRPTAILSTMLHANSVAVLALKLSGHKARIVLREATVPTPGGSIHNQSVYWASSFLYRFSDAVIAVSEGTRDGIVSVLSLPPSLPISVINNPLSPELEVLKDEELLLDLPGEAGIPWVMAAGRLSETKDFTTLVKAIRQVNDHRNVRLFILGEGPQRDQLRVEIENLGLSDLVFLLGFQKNPFQFMSRCSLFVLSSRLEGSPNIVIQAVACGAEVVASRLKGCTDVLLEPEGVGELVECGDVDGFAKAIIRTLDSPRRPDVASWKRRFSSKLTADEYEKVLLNK